VKIYNYKKNYKRSRKKYPLVSILEGFYDFCEMITEPPEIFDYIDLQPFIKKNRDFLLFLLIWILLGIVIYMSFQSYNVPVTPTN